MPSGVVLSDFLQIGTERPQNVREEIANSLSHGLALLAAIGALPYLVAAVRHLGGIKIFAIAVFAVTMVLLYLTSTLYHALPPGRAKSVVLKLDQGAIYVFIAGTYTAFALGTVSSPLDWVLLALIWSIAIVCAMLKAFDRLTHPWLSTGLYLLIGWLALIAAMPIMERLPVAGLAWLVAGGAAYTVGVIFFLLDSRLRYAHAVWHCFVAAGTGCHFFAVLDNAI
jgi:hemolysin III